MEEIASKFKEEYTELLSRYKEHLSNAQIMSVLQSVTRKQIGFKNNPEIKWHDLQKDPNDLPEHSRYVWTNMGTGYHDEYGWYDDYGSLQGVIAWCEPKFKGNSNA